MKGLLKVVENKLSDRVEIVLHCIAFVGEQLGCNPIKCADRWSTFFSVTFLLFLSFIRSFLAWLCLLTGVAF